MSTSASTGTGNLSTSGEKTEAPKSAKATKDTVANTTAQPDPKERNTPDGAPVVTREEDVVAGARVDLPPSAPADASKTEPAPQGGINEVMRPDGSIAMIDTNDEDYDEHAEDIRTGKRFV